MTSLVAKKEKNPKDVRWHPEFENDPVMRQYHVFVNEADFEEEVDSLETCLETRIKINAEMAAEITGKGRRLEMPTQNWPARRGSKTFEWSPMSPSGHPLDVPANASALAAVGLAAESSKAVVHAGTQLQPDAIRARAAEAQRRLAEAQLAGLQSAGGDSHKEDKEDEEDKPDKKDKKEKKDKKAKTDEPDSEHDLACSLMKRCKADAETCMSLIFSLTDIPGSDSTVEALKGHEKDMGNWYPERKLQ